MRARRRHVADAAACRAHKARLCDLVDATLRATWDGRASVHVNRVDDAPDAQPYRTVTGTSAECGDDGEVGRGNRVGGLFTPCRPMSMEAAAGKKPINHVGKLYNVAAHRLARTLCATIDGVAAAQVYLVSEIGRRLDDPHAVHVELELADGCARDDVLGGVETAIEDTLAATATLWRDLLARRVALF